MFKIIKKISVFSCLLIVAMMLAHFALAADGVVDVGTGNIDGTSIGETTGLGQEDPRIIAAKIVRIVFGFLGILAVGLIIYAGWLYMTAGGEEEKVEKAKKILIGAVIGIIICLASFAIVSFILNKLLEATGVGGKDNTNSSGSTGVVVGGGIGGTKLPGVGEPCSKDILDTACSAGSCEGDLTCNSACLCEDVIASLKHCYNGEKDFDETDIDCGGKCGFCDGVACVDNTTKPVSCNNNLCSSRVCGSSNSTVESCVAAGYPSGTNNCCLCQRPPIIAGISPVGGFCSNDSNKGCSKNNDCGGGNSCDTNTPNGATGNFFTIYGKYFGSVKSLFENVLTNVDFEKGAIGTVPTDWNASAQKNASVGISKEEKKSGMQSIKIHQDPGHSYPGVCNKVVCENLNGCTWNSGQKQCSFNNSDDCHLAASITNPAIYKEGEILCWGNTNRVMWARLVYNVSKLKWNPGEKYIIKFYYKGHISVPSSISLGYNLGWNSQCVLKSGIYLKSDGTCLYGDTCTNDKKYCCVNAPKQEACYSAINFPSIKAGDYKDWTEYSAMFTYSEEITKLKTKEGVLNNEIGLAIGYNNTGLLGTDFYIDDFIVAKLPAKGNVLFLGTDDGGVDDKAAAFPSDINPNCSSSWQDNQIIIAVPNGSVSGPIKIVAESGLEIITDKAKIPNFKANNIKRPGLCSIDRDAGSLDNPFTLQGVSFLGTDQKVLFGNKNSNVFANNVKDWTNMAVTASVPNIQDGKIPVFVSINSVDSNSLGFTVKNNVQNNPIINHLDPIEGPKGQYVTIYGSNFKNFKLGISAVKFYLSADPNTKISADVDFPKQCQSKYWNDTYITIKVPQVTTIGDYKIIVINSDNSSSTPANFKITAGSPSPGLCLLDPYNGPVGQSVIAYGEYFGSSQGTNGRVVFYNNINSPASSWADQEIKTNVPNGSQTGPFKIINNNQKISNALPFKVGACSSNADCLNSSVEECCASGTYNAGVCKLKGECSFGGVRSCVFSWNFSTAPDVNIFTCSGYNTASACLATDMCPNSPGKCQTSKNNITIGDCSNVECNKTVGCNGQCVYDQTLNKCKLVGGVCNMVSTTIIAGFTTECQNVKDKNIWQINTKGASCPIGTYLEINGLCSVGSLASPIECSLCSSGFTCQEGQCVIQSSGCPVGSICDSNGKCKKDKETCECCCRVANSQQDCCAGLTCQAGGCGTGAPNYGVCTGCKVVISGQIDKVLSDKSCNCSGKPTRYCDLTDQVNYPLGRCNDQKIAGENCYDSFNGGTCDMTSSICSIGLVCDSNDCKCKSSDLLNQPCDGNLSTATCDVDNSKCQTGYTCDSSSCKCKSSDSLNQPCDGNLSTATCDVDNSKCQTGYTCDSSSCKCENIYTGPQFNKTCAKQATSTLSCDANVCKNFSCLNSDGINTISVSTQTSISCGLCCCDPFAAVDQCKTLNSKLICLKNKGNCSGEKRGLCCGCKSDDECGNAGLIGCGTDTCCYSRPKATLTTPTNNQGVCRNTVIEASFDQIMDITSFNNNIFLIGDYEDKICPSGAKFLGENISKRNNNIFSRVIKKVLISLEKIVKPIFGKNVFATDHNYCLVNGIIGGRVGVASTTIAIFTLQKPLDANRKYYVVIKGDSIATSATTTNNIEKGVLNKLNIGMKGGNTQTFNAKTFSNSKIWSFTTSRNICQLDNVVIDPVSYLFQTSENNPDDDDPASPNYDTINDSDKVYRASATAINGQEILPFNGVYSWSWSWNIGNEEVVNFKNLTNINQQTLVAQNKQDAKTVVDAKATITDDTVTGTKSTGQSKTGKANVYVLMCANPWPPIADNNTWQPWRDSSNNCSAGLVGAGCSNNNFEFYYCRDAGQKGTADDLPAILKDTVVRGFSSDLNILKEYYFLREDLPSITVLSVNDQHTGGRVVANWDSIANASGYKLYYGKTKGQYDNFIDVGNVTSRIVTGLINGQTYYFAVSAYYKNTGAESVYSNEESITPTDTIAPLAPINPRATVANQKVTLTWSKASDDTAYYIVYYGTASQVYGAESVKVNLADSCSTTECNITFENLVNNTIYYFAIKAFDSYNNSSGFSVEKSAILQ